MKFIYTGFKSSITLLIGLFLLVNVGNKATAQCQAYFKSYVAVDSMGIITVYCQDSSTTSPDSIINRTWSLNNVTMSAGNKTTVSIPCSTTAPLNVVKLTISTSSLCQSTYIDTIEGCNTGVFLQYFNQDTIQTFCNTPANVGLYVYGNLLGYNVGDTVWMHVNYQDGTDTNLYTIAFQNYFFSWFFHEYKHPGLYYPQVTVYSPDSLSSNSMVINSPLDIGDTCGVITGAIYLDNNQNCIYDAGDGVAANRHVILSGPSVIRHTFTDQNGIYSFNVVSGPSYGIQLDTLGNWHAGDLKMVCPQDGFIAVTSVPSPNNNMFATCPTGYDLNAQLTGWRFVPGREGQICVYPYDQRCVSPNGQVHVILDSLLTPLPDTSVGGYTIHGDTVSWNVTSGGFYNNSHCIRVVTSTGAVMGDSVCATVILEPIAGDSVPANNIQTRCWAVRTSWDPNEKSASPAGDGVNNAIRPGTELTYTILFQNTGNASAQNIYILDTLDASLELYSLKILSSSHTMVPDILDGSVLRFAFNNINLPDSNSNEPLSHGYVTYSILPIDPIANGTVINNTAAIYFDYNAPVITNTVFHTIDFFLGTSSVQEKRSLQLFPNPASERVFIRMDTEAKAEVKIYDLAGRMVLGKTLEHSGYISVIKLPVGVYKVQMIQGDDVINTSIVIVR